MNLIFKRKNFTLSEGIEFRFIKLRRENCIKEIFERVIVLLVTKERHYNEKQIIVYLTVAASLDLLYKWIFTLFNLNFKIYDNFP